MVCKCFPKKDAFETCEQHKKNPLTLLLKNPPFSAFYLYLNVKIYVLQYMFDF